jgi:hypothetical protein
MILSIGALIAALALAVSAGALVFQVADDESRPPRDPCVSTNPFHEDNPFDEDSC